MHLVNLLDSSIVFVPFLLSPLFQATPQNSDFDILNIKSRHSRLRLQAYKEILVCLLLQDQHIYISSNTDEETKLIPILTVQMTQRSLIAAILINQLSPTEHLEVRRFKIIPSTYLVFE